MAKATAAASHSCRIVLGALLALSLAAPASAAKKAITPESIKEDLVVARCKAEAKKYYSFLHPRKRRLYEKNCVARGWR